MIKLRQVYLLAKSRFILFTGKLNAYSALALAGILGPLVLVGGDLGAGLTTPGYSLINSSISSLALTHIGWLQTIGFLALGLLVEVFTAGLLFNVKRGRWFYLGIFALVLFGFGMLCIGAFNTDPANGLHTRNGMIHQLATKISFGLFPVAALLLAFNFKQDIEWRLFYKYSLASCIVSILLAVSLLFFKEGAGYFGLVERLVVANMLLWVEVMAVNMFRLSLKRSAPVDKEVQIG
ncbi:MAG TPA: DUF998 domain-containing protein [Dehalococcoidales bacterium]|nr:DUF998 domain-containing protein [Dehalococcoidales bacterium]